MSDAFKEPQNSKHYDSSIFSCMFNKTEEYQQTFQRFVLRIRTKCFIINICKCGRNENAINIVSNFSRLVTLKSQVSTENSYK